MGEHMGAAVLHPKLAGGAEVDGKARHLEPAVSGQQRRGGTVCRHALGLDQEIGDPGAILAHRLKLFDRHSRTVEPGGRALEHFWLAARSEEHTSELQSLMRTSYAV